MDDIDIKQDSEDASLWNVAFAWSQLRRNYF